MKITTKDKNLLTTSSLTISRIGICVGVSAMLLLTGCGMSGVTNIFSDSRSPQKVEGARRAPAYNNRAIKPPEQSSVTSPKLPPMVTNVSPEKVETVLESPYDKYDSAGNEVPEAEMAKIEDKPENNKGFFSGWFGFDDDTPKETVEPKDVEPKGYVEQPIEPTVVRKSFLGNPYTPRAFSPQPKFDEVHAKEPRISFADNVEPAKATDPIPVTEKAPELVIATDANAANTNINMTSNVESQPAPENETLLGRIGSKLDVFELSAREPEKLQQDYPEISSVPPRSAAFDAVKRDQQQNLNELKLDHSTSQEEKKLLEREAPTPSVPDLSNQPPSSSVQPLLEPAAPIVADSKKDEVKESPPVADVTVDSPAKYEIKTDADKVPPPAPFLTSEKTNVVEDVAPEAIKTSAEEEPSLFERIFGKTSEVKPADEAPSGKIEEAIPVYSGPVSSLNEVTVEAQPDKKDESQEQSRLIDELAASATAIATANSSANSAFEPVADAEPLPSPDIIKTMRPSRYDARRNSAQNSN